MSQRVLIVEDDPNLQEVIRYVLSNEGYAVTAVSSGEEAIEALSKQIPEIVLLDIILPGIDGYAVCEKIKQNRRFDDVLVVMLSQKGSEDEIAHGLKTYADDYISKPFSTKVLLARIESILRRQKKFPKEVSVIVEYGDLRIDPETREVFVDGTLVSLRGAEFAILHYLSRSPGRIFSRDQIIAEIKGVCDYSISERVIDNHIFWLRKKLGEFSYLVETVSGVGYRLKA